MVSPLEKMRHEMKTIIIAAMDALLDAGVTSAKKHEDKIPYYYQTRSWEVYGVVPWVFEEEEKKKKKKKVDLIS